MTAPAAAHASVKEILDAVHETTAQSGEALARMLLQVISRAQPTPEPETVIVATRIVSLVAAHLARTQGAEDEALQQLFNVVDQALSVDKVISGEIQVQPTTEMRVPTAPAGPVDGPVDAAVFDLDSWGKAPTS